MGNTAKRMIKKMFGIITYINKIMPKKTKRIVIASELGFRDNIRSLYEYLVENHYNEKYTIICALNDHKVYRGQAKQNVKFVNLYVGIFYYLTSKYRFYRFALYPIKPTAK